ncbi:MAG: AMP-binding protein [Microbacteriaceae bacterium]|nr:AMP-binding protein [Microbacteriaceae bacterium]MCI1207119.1 AMP-binding protein [Microbacteriaceae bacterium]
MTEEYPRPWREQFPPEVPVDMPPVPVSSLAERIDMACREYADRPAFTNMGTTLSFSQIGELSDAVAAYLLGELGLSKGDRVVVQMPNVLQFPIIEFGILKAGMIPVNMNPLYTVPEMRVLLDEARPRAFFVLENFAYKIAKLVPETTIDAFIVTGAADVFGAGKRAAVSVGLKVRRMVPAYQIPGVIHFREVLRVGRGRPYTRPEISLDDVALLQFTGGTTGRPKGAMLTNRSLLSNGQQMLEEMRVVLREGEDVVIAALPLYHIFCLTVNCITFFSFGLHNVLVTNPREVDVLARIIVRRRPALMMVVTTLANALLDAPRFQRGDLSSFKFCVSGGAALDPTTAERWLRRVGTPIVEGYGLTEASPVVAVSPTWRLPETRMGTVGLPLPSTEIRILDESGADLPLEEAGELWVSGPQVMAGYWGHPEETQEVLSQDGWLDTGDIAVLHADGSFSIVDRRKDMICVSGFNVYPTEVEQALRQIPGIRDAGVIGVPDQHSGEVVKAFLVRDDPSVTEQAVRRAARTRLAGYKRPKHIEFCSELPISETGKVLRRSLRAPEK